MLLLSGAIGLLALIVCANLAGLQLVRTLSRQRELVVRGTMGATWRRLARQLLTETAVVSVRAISTDMLDFRARVLAIEGSKLRLMDSDSDPGHSAARLLV